MERLEPNTLVKNISYMKNNRINSTEKLISYMNIAPLSHIPAIKCSSFGIIFLLIITKLSFIARIQSTRT